MKDFWTLVGFEYKKLRKRRMVWITLAVLTMLGIVCGFANVIGGVYVDGERISGTYEMQKKDTAYGRALSGTLLDGENLQKVQEAYAKVPEGTSFVSTVEEFDAYAGPYQGLWKMVEQITGTDDVKENLSVNAGELYEMRSAAQKRLWAGSYLTEGETDYLQNLEEQVKKPLAYGYADGWEQLLYLLLTLGVMQIFLVAICVPMIFSEEHSRKTRALILCTPRGKKILYYAKIFTACSFSLAGTLVLLVSTAISTFAVYGMDGFGAQLQNMDIRAPWPLSVGVAVLISFGISLVTALLHSIFAAVLAEKTRNALIPMAVLIGALLLGQIASVPPQYRILSQLWDALPFRVVAYWNVFTTYLYEFFGRYIPAWQALPVLYLLISAGMCIWGCRIYCRTER